MENINDLIDFIKNNNPQEEDIWEEDWEEFLMENFPNWRSLVKDPINWPLIEEAEPPRGFNPLCRVLVDAAGAGLAARWFDSNMREQREASRDWMRENSINLTPEIWNELSSNAKEYVVHYIFDRYPGEPFSSFRRASELIEYGFLYLRYLIVFPPLPPTGYVPSHEIQQLRSVTRRANDKRFLKVVEDMIKGRKEACEKTLSLPRTSRIVFIPTRDERELIARVMDKFRANGYMLSALPQIYLSFEAPPLFVAYPELEEEEIEERRPEQREPYIPRNRERRRPELISIEELLGCYLPNPQIILYQRGLKWCARRYDFDEELLRGIVLVHEIGHWVTHLLPKPGVPSWSTELYKLTSTEVKEGWAQLITWWVIDEIGGRIRHFFEELNRLQPHPYHIYEEFKSYSVDSLINSLEMLRQLHWPAGINDWKRFIKQICFWKV